MRLFSQFIVGCVLLLGFTVPGFAEETLGGPIEYPHHYTGHCADDPLSSACPRLGLDVEIAVPDTVEIGETFPVSLRITNSMLLPPDWPSDIGENNEFWQAALECFEDPNRQYVEFVWDKPHVSSSGKAYAKLVEEHPIDSYKIFHGETKDIDFTYMATRAGLVYFLPTGQDGTCGWSYLLNGGTTGDVLFHRVCAKPVCWNGIAQVSRRIFSPYVEIVNNFRAEVTVEPTKLKVGEHFTVTIRVMNGLKSAISNVTWNDPPVEEYEWVEAEEDVVQVVSLVSEPSSDPMNLEPGQGYVFVFEYAALKPILLSVYPDDVDIGGFIEGCCSAPAVPDDTIHDILITSSEEGDIVVNVEGDEDDLDLEDNICDVDLFAEGPQCTLRAAIQHANASGGQDTVVFDVPGSPIPVIRPDSPLPAITDPIVIDGTTQPLGGLVMVDGMFAGGGVDGVRITAGNTTLRGLMIVGFAGNGIMLQNGGNVIEKCFIGTDNQMTGGLGNGGSGILVNGGFDNRIGGMSEDQANTIAYNGGDGVSVMEGNANAILGNAIFANSALGIDLGGNGVTENDALDMDVGPNHF